MINGVAYAWEDIQIELAGRILVGVQDVEYGVSREHANIYGRGSDAVEISKGGKKTPSAKIKVLQNEFKKFTNALKPGQDPTDVVFKMTVAFLNEANGLETDVLYYCRISEWKKGMNTDSTHMEIELPILPGKIKINV